jgi:cytochrome c oxidase assembly factor CtaG
MLRQLFDQRNSRRELDRRGFRINLTALAVCSGLIFSAAAFIVGTVCAVVAYVNGNPAVHTAGTILLAAFIPSLLLAGCCSDLMDTQLRRRNDQPVTAETNQGPGKLIPFRAISSRG